MDTKSICVQNQLSYMLKKCNINVMSNNSHNWERIYWIVKKKIIPQFDDKYTIHKKFKYHIEYSCGFMDSF